MRRGLAFSRTDLAIILLATKKPRGLLPRKNYSIFILLAIPLVEDYEFVPRKGLK